MNVPWYLKALLWFWLGWSFCTNYQHLRRYLREKKAHD